MILSTEKKWLLEWIFWVISFIVCMLILMPILFSVRYYPFMLINVIAILAALHYTRLSFLNRITPYGHLLVAKLFIVFTAIPVILLLVDNLLFVMGFIDKVGLYSFLKSLPENDIEAMSFYIKLEFIFFSVWAIIAVLLAPFSMMKAIWAQYNPRNKR